MKNIERRGFLLSALAAGPLAACAGGAPPAAAPPVPRGRAGILVRGGRDRLGSPRRVFGGLRIDAKVHPGDSGGDLYVIEHSDEARGGPPRHVHHEQDEWFYVLEGSYRLEVGDERFELGPEGVGRLIIAFQPAGRMEPFLAALAGAGSAPSPDELRPLFSAHGMSVVGPPLPV
jgi:hypothetical protein